MSTFFVKLKPAKTHTCSPLLSPKQIGTVCFAIFSILISAPLFATGVSSGATSADCDNATLDTYTGTSNLQVDWQPNNIALHWYNGDTEITSGVQTSCVYDGTLTPPTTIPTKTGYTFKGWRVKQTPCSFASQVCSLTGSGVNGLTYDDSDDTAYGYYSSNGIFSENASIYGLTSTGTWAVKDTSGGIIKGIASCNSTNGGGVYDSCESNAIKPGNTFSNSSSGQYCWCKISSYTPTGGNVCNVASPSWVFSDDGESAYGCASACAMYCAADVMGHPYFRRAVFGVAAN